MTAEVAGQMLGRLPGVLPRDRGVETLVSLSVGK